MIYPTRLTRGTRLDTMDLADRLCCEGAPDRCTLDRPALQPDNGLRTGQPPGQPRTSPA